jgi:hypothetical protein
VSWIEILLAIVSQVFAAGAVYGAIRGDIQHLHAGVAEAKQKADQAHKRIDHVLMDKRR